MRSRRLDVAGDIPSIVALGLGVRLFRASSLFAPFTISDGKEVWVVIWKRGVTIEDESGQRIADKGPGSACLYPVGDLWAWSSAL